MNVESDIFDTRMNDGSRHFACLPQSAGWDALRAHLARLGGVEITGFVTDGVIEAWIDFRMGGHRFSVNNQLGEWWFFVRDPSCDLAVLQTVLHHCNRLLIGN